ncbi:hypothetical protein [Flavobacterium aestivum]|uniref:hypothetical protein n=1 Tax=Flavobacterium aestivum TaxID=3003257 RepID=UPI0024828A71|nr:hypothetical protein [Flavobacterium aestivum]
MAETRIFLEITSEKGFAEINGNALRVCASLSSFFHSNPEVKKLFKASIDIAEKYEAKVTTQLAKNEPEKQQ